MDDTTLERLLELIKRDCPRDKSWSVAVRTYALAQRMAWNEPEPQRHQLAYAKVQEYFNGGNKQ